MGQQARHHSQALALVNMLKATVALSHVPD